MTRPLPRRRVLALLSLGVVAACDPARRVAAPTASPATTAAPSSTPAGPTPAPIPPPAPRPRPTPSRDLPTPSAFAPVAPDLAIHLPAAKEVAGEVAQAVTTHDVDTDAAAIVAGLPLAEPDTAGDLAAVITPLVEPGTEAVGATLHVQLGGLDPAPEAARGEPRRSAMLVVVDQHVRRRGGLLGLGGDVEVTRRCMDVRLVAVDGRWLLDGIASIGGTPVARPDDLSPAAARLLDHADVDLPDTARWDVHAGRVEDRLLDAMADLADEVPLRVTCLATGHPRTVFARSAVSNHTIGRAVDIWAVGGTEVVLASPSAVGLDASRSTDAHAAVEWLMANSEVDELGSPWDLDGPREPDGPPTRSFTNVVHVDHLHVAFDHE